MTTTLKFKKRVSRKHRRALANMLRPGFRLRLNTDSITLHHKKTDMRPFSIFLMRTEFCGIT